LIIDDAEPSEGSSDPGEGSAEPCQTFRGLGDQSFLQDSR